MVDVALDPLRHLPGESLPGVLADLADERLAAYPSSSARPRARGRWCLRQPRGRLIDEPFDMKTLPGQVIQRSLALGERVAWALLMLVAFASGRGSEAGVGLELVQLAVDPS